MEKIKMHSLKASRECVFCYLLKITTKAIIKANAIIDTITKLEKSKSINCNKIFSIINTTPLYVKWQPHFCISLFKNNYTAE